MGIRRILHSKVFTFAVTAVIVVAGLMIGIQVTKGKPTYPINVVYSSAPGLFTGAAVDVLGVKVGSVTNVQNVGNTVHVTLAVNQGTKIPSAAFASLVAPQLLGSPDVDLNPGYTSGPYLPSNATIGVDHTAVPVSTDELLKELQHSLSALNPHAVGSLVSNLATDLDGQGQNLNKLIASAAGTVQLLAEKGNDLGQLNGTLAQLTGTLDGDTAQIEQLIEQYDTVSSTVAQHSGQLNDAITQLSQASANLVQLLVPNLQPLEADVGTVTTVGRTLDRNLSNVDEILQNGNNLFHGAQRAYDPSYNWLDLNLETAPGVSGAYLAGLIRDRLAGICRRLAANHSNGLSAAVLATLTQCGNPSSSFFDPLVNEIPTIINSLTGQSPSTTAQSLLQQGLQQITNATQNAGSGSTTPSAGANAPTSPGPTTTTTTVPPTTTTTTQPCNLLTEILGCKSGSSSSSSGSSGSSGSSKSSGSSGGLGGLLSNKVTAAQNAVAIAAPATTSSSQAPSLTAPAAGLLPPLPQDPSRGHHARRSPGLLSQWAHDIASWF
ncbi:MAG TPA: MlaD family protein [Acidimicrobiales bacterium]|jgi:phospholipid/cholesterol/gamma-HCH transport system substrate-binding protein|nr:MlaD family protein [Acidimicrobiales bacterium]